MLNETVKAKISKAHLQNELRPEHTEAHLSSEPVYKNRSRLVTFVLHALAFGVMASAPPAEVAFWLVVTYAYVDFYGGLLHHVLDDQANLKLPVIGTGCLEFQWHHLIPYDISSESWLDVIGALNVLASIKWVLVGAIWYACPTRSDRSTWLLLTAIIYVWGVVGQYSHRQAHMPEAKRSVFATTLQKLGLLVDPSFHLAHHKQAFDAHHPPSFGSTYPILSGVSGKLLERLLPLSSNNFVWIAAWFSIHFTDVFAFAALGTALSSMKQ
jgi:palmitoyl-[glycerolipid] 3-(E)-desaturase